MRKLALATLSFALVFSLCPTAGLAAYAEGTDLLLSTGQAEASLDGIGDVDTTEDAIELPDTETSNVAKDSNTLAPLLKTLEDDGTAGSSVPYLDANGMQQTCDSFTRLLDNNTDLHDGWYVVHGPISSSGRMTVSGDVNLIIEDNSSLSAQAGIEVSRGGSLTIYAQSTGGSIGRLVVSGASSGCAGIGGNASTSAGTITINGGKMQVTGGEYAAGIGGGQGQGAGSIAINGGMITATGGTEAASIGGGKQGSGGTIIINGGTITATGSNAAAGIGGGKGGLVGTVTVSGGHIIANISSSATHDTCIGNTMSLSTGSNGTAFIETNDQSFTGNDRGFESGIILSDGNYYVRGNQTLSGDTAVESSKVLQLYSSATLTIPAGVTLTNNNIIKSNANTTLVVNGHLVNNGAIENIGGLIKGTGTLEGDKPVASKPSAPTAEAISSTSVTLKAMPDVGYGPVEYVRTAGGGTPVWWQSSPTFDSLQPDTEYTFYARYCGNDFYEESTSPGTMVRTPTPRPGIVSNITVAADNYLGADFVMPGDYVADAILPDDAIQQIASGKDVDLWLESTREVSDDDAALIQAQLDDYLPITSFKLTSYWQADGEVPVKGAAQTKDDAMVQISLALPDSAVNADPSITREYKVVCVYDGKAQVIPATFDPSDNTLRFRTNRLASFGLACKDTRDGKAVYPVMVRNSYAQQSGQGQYAAGDKVTVYSGEREGYMVDFWSASPQDKVTFTYEGSDRAEFAMPDSPVVVTPTWIRIGDVKDVTDVSGNALHARLVDKGAALAGKVLDNEAMDLVKGGMEASIWLESSRGVTDVDAAAIAGALGDWTLAEKIDLALFYEVDGKTVQVHEANEPLVVSLTLPDSITGDTSKKTRSYEVIRVHDGKVSVIPSSFDADAKTLTFETDRFSAYAVAYKDAVDEGIGGTTEDDGKAPAQDDDDALNSSLAMTGDISMPTTLVLAALAALSILLVARRLRV